MAKDFTGLHLCNCGFSTYQKKEGNCVNHPGKNIEKTEELYKMMNSEHIDSLNRFFGDLIYCFIKKIEELHLSDIDNIIKEKRTHINAFFSIIL